MGNLEHIDQLETYIMDLGNEIKNVKKASEYLKLIEQFQSEIAKTSTNLNQTKDQLKTYQEIMEGKLELFQTTSRNIESKQQSLEQLQLSTLESLVELKQQQETSEKVINRNHKTLVGEFNRVQEEQKLFLNGMSNANKIYFGINAVLSVSVIGILVGYLIM